MSCARLVGCALRQAGVQLHKHYEPVRPCYLFLIPWLSLFDVICYCDLKSTLSDLKESGITPGYIYTKCFFNWSGASVYPVILPHMETVHNKGLLPDSNSQPTLSPASQRKLCCCSSNLHWEDHWILNSQLLQ